MFKWVRTKDVRDRILFTIFILIIFQIGTFIPLPYINRDKGLLTGISSLLNLTSGGTLKRFGILMLGISPYITASIIIQLLQKGIPTWKRKSYTQKGQSAIGQYTRLASMIFAVLQGSGILFNSFMAKQIGFTVSSRISDRILILFLLVCGSLFVSYLAEQIDENGIGQGASIMIAVGILSTMPGQVKNIINLYPIFKKANNLLGYFTNVFIILGLFIFLSILSYFINKKEFRYPIQSMVNKYRVKAHFFPIKLLASSVMPVIFSSAVLSVAGSIATIKGYNWQWTRYTTKTGLLIYIFLIFLFSFIYNYIQIDCEELQKSFRENGIYFIGVRQSDTSSFISKKIFNITLIGAPTLTIIATLAIFVEKLAPKQFGLNLTGISLLIVIGVFQELAHQVKGLTDKHNYKEIF